MQGESYVHHKATSKRLMQYIMLELRIQRR